MSDNEIVIKVENLSLRGVGNLYEPEAKRYRLGLIGGKTLRTEGSAGGPKSPFLIIFPLTQPVVAKRRFIGRQCGGSRLL